MRKTLLIISLLILSVGFSQQLTEVVETYNNGTVKEIKYHKKTRDGIELVKGETYYSSGQKESEGTYKDGEKDGKWTQWYENGQKKAEGTYKDGQLDGKVKGYYENGQKRSEATLKDGKPDGKGTSWYENGQMREEETYKDGVSNGKHTHWHENGKKKAEGTYKDGQLDGKVKGYYENGQKRSEATLKDGKPDGKGTSWYENGQMREEETYKDGVSNGKHTHWHENGKKKAEITYKDGMLIHTDLALLLDKEIQCNDDSIMVTRISIEIEKNLIPFDEPYPTLLWWKVVQNLSDAGASRIIFNSNIPNITESYLDIESMYNNVYRNLNKDELNQFEWWVQKQDHFHRRLYCLGIDINSNIMPKFQLAQIMDTEDVTLSDPMEDLDWMSHFLPGEIPEWIKAIENPQERQDMMDAMGIGEGFDITKSPFYNNIILIGF